MFFIFEGHRGRILKSRQPWKCHPTVLGWVLGFLWGVKIFPWYPPLLSIFVAIPRFSRSFWSVLLEPSLVLEPFLEPVLEPSLVRFSVLPSCQEPYFGLCHGLFQRVQISTLRFRHRSIPPRCKPTNLWSMIYHWDTMDHLSSHYKRGRERERFIMWLYHTIV